MAEQIIYVIEKLPPYICYIYPGYISMFLFYYFNGLTLNDTKSKVIKCITLSYLYILVAKKVIIPFVNESKCIELSCENQALDFHIVLILLSVIIPYFIYIGLFKNDMLTKILKFLSIDTVTYKNEINLLQSKYDDTIWIRVYMKDKNLVYSGSLTENELEEGKAKFFCLSKYRKYLIKQNGKEKKLVDFSNDDKEKVLIYLEQVSHFEVVNIDKGDDE